MVLRSWRSTDSPFRSGSRTGVAFVVIVPLVSWTSSVVGTAYMAARNLLLYDRLGRESGTAMGMKCGFLLAHKFPAPSDSDWQQCVGETQRDVVRGQEVSASERQGMASGGLRQRAQQVQFTDSFLEMMGPTKKFPRI
jgi:hypothetical protein